MNTRLTYRDCQKIRARHARQRLLLAFIVLGVLALLVFALTGCTGGGDPTPRPIVYVKVVTPLPASTPDRRVCDDSIVCWP